MRFQLALLVAGCCFGQSRIASDDSAVVRITRLPANAQRNALRELLHHPPNNYDSFCNAVFFHEAQLRSALRQLASDRVVGERAVYLLALIADPEDLRSVVRRPPKAKRGFKQWAYYVATALLDARTNEDWAFLERCALQKYDDPWSVTGAIHTLRLIASSRSISVLEEVGRQNPRWTSEIQHALQYARSEPLPLSASTLPELVGRASRATRTGRWTGIGETRFNEVGDKALIDLQFASGQDRYTYTATLHKVGDHWRISALREVVQALVAPAPGSSDWQ